MKKLTVNQEGQLAQAIAAAVKATLTPSSNAEPEVTPAVRGFVLKGDIAKMVMKTPRTVEAWSAKGWIPSVLIGRSRLYDPEAVRRALIERGGIGMKAENN